ncbi:MAG: hypothetical protein KDE31_02035 [Caldilineaceae bacterium]|nr:hypothetical protein [Caldilineaceae bacterium]
MYVPFIARILRKATQPEVEAGEDLVAQPEARYPFADRGHAPGNALMRLLLLGLALKTDGVRPSLHDAPHAR